MAAKRRRTKRSTVSTLEMESTHPADPGDIHPLILVPGLLGSKQDFLEIMIMLSRRGHFSVAYDLPGQFESPPPPLSMRYGFEEMAEDLVFMAEILFSETGRLPHVVGHSMGGLISRAAVIEAPGFFRSLVLIGSGKALPSGPLRELLEAITTDAQLAREEKSLEVVGHLLANSVDGADARSFLNMARCLVDEPDRSSDLLRTNTPVLVIAGTNDPIISLSDQEEAASAVGGAFEAIPSAGHNPMIDSPHAIGRALHTWLERLHGSEYGS